MTETTSIRLKKSIIAELIIGSVFRSYEILLSLSYFVGYLKKIEYIV